MSWRLGKRNKWNFFDLVFVYENDKVGGYVLDMYEYWMLIINLGLMFIKIGVFYNDKLIFDWIICYDL